MSALSIRPGDPYTLSAHGELLIEEKDFINAFY